VEKESNFKKVVGLEYQVGTGLPQVILKGSGPLAEELLQQRMKSGKETVFKNPELVDQLYRLPVDSYIGPELFRFVAVILAHVLAVDRKIGEGKK